MVLRRISVIDDNAKTVSKPRTVLLGIVGVNGVGFGVGIIPSILNGISDLVLWSYIRLEVYVSFLVDDYISVAEFDLVGDNFDCIIPCRKDIFEFKFFTVDSRFQKVYRLVCHVKLYRQISVFGIVNMPDNSEPSVLA